MTRAMLYDLDGVILDSRALVAATLTDVAAERLGSPPPPTAVADVIHLPPVDALRMLGVVDPAQAFDDHFDTIYATHASRAALVPGILPVLCQFRRAGVRQAVVTLQRRHRLDMVNLGEVRDLIDTFVTYEDATPKPAPDAVLAALDRLGATAARAWFVGDTPTDVAAGHAAGVRVAGATWGYSTAETLERAGADLLISHPGQITTTTLADRSVTVGYDDSACGVAVPKRSL